MKELYTIIVTKKILTGALAGIIVQDKFQQSNPYSSRRVGKEYDGITHRYLVLDISRKLNELITNPYL